jgi:hypothetical protein
MKATTIFRILTFILLPIAGVFGLLGLFMLLIALSNLGLLFSVFMVAAFVIYVFASLQFLTKGMDTGKPCKPGLRDWIRVNAFVTIFMCASSLFSVITILLQGDASLREQAMQMRNALKDAPPMLNMELFVRTIKLASWFMGILSILTLIHIFLNFRLMKRYRHLFNAPVPEA